MLAQRLRQFLAGDARQRVARRTRAERNDEPDRLQTIRLRMSCARQNRKNGGDDSCDLCLHQNSSLRSSRRRYRGLIPILLMSFLPEPPAVSLHVLAASCFISLPP
jgi:hypothetical protein